MKPQNQNYGPSSFHSIYGDFMLKEFMQDLMHRVMAPLPQEPMSTLDWYLAN